MSHRIIVLKTIAEKGGNLEIDSEYRIDEVEEIIQIAKEKNVNISIQSKNYRATALYRFVELGGKNLTIKF